MNSRIVRGNLPLLLNQPNLMWTVRSGSIALFAVKIIHGIPEGERRYLFEVKTGEAIFSVMVNDQEDALGILGVAIEPAELEEEAIVEIEQPQLLPFLESWIHRLSQVQGLPKSAVAKPVVSDRYISLVNEQIFQPPKAQVVWVQCQQGTAQWLGYDSLRVTTESGIFPLAAGFWIQSTGDAQLSVQSTIEVEMDAWIAGLNQLHTYFLQSIATIALQETQAEVSRFQKRQQLNQQVTQDTLKDLAALLRPRQLDQHLEADELLMVAGAVGKALGATIAPPMEAEDVSRRRSLGHHGCDYAAFFCAIGGGKRTVAQLLPTLVRSIAQLHFCPSLGIIMFCMIRK
jgi:hypothetical protein